MKDKGSESLRTMGTACAAHFCTPDWSIGSVWLSFRS
jgi:hypothetical protein